MINFKQEELIDGLMREIREKYPEVALIKVTESAENPSTLWIKVTAPEDEEREIEMREYASGMVADILLDYGYHMLVLPMRRIEEAA